MIFDYDIERLIRAVYSGKVTPFELPVDLYYAIADYLKKGLYQGFGITFGELTSTIEKSLPSVFDQTDLELLTELRENVYIFSAAKTFQEVQDFTGALVGEDGRMLTLKEFTEKVTTLDAQYNKNWITTEYDTAYGQAQSAVQWNQIQKDKAVLNVLKYSAVLDERTSDICAPLDGITLPVDDPFWDKFMPLNHFNCRCTVEQLPDGDITDQYTAEAAMKATQGRMKEEGQELFLMNPGKDRIVFTKDHPYFEVESKYKDFAKNNFGLPIPDED